MADPLTELADREVPARTNYFDPAAAQDVISRYGNARRSYESSRVLSDAQDRATRQAAEQERLAREQVTWDRADLEYKDRQEAKRMRGDFLRNMQQQIDPKSPDYNRQVIAFKTSLPPDLQDDDVINSILTSMNAEADDWRSRSNAEASKDQTRESQLAVIRERAKLGMSYDVKDEDVKAATREDGSIDEFKLGTIAGENRRSNAANEFDRRQKAMVEGRLQVLAAADLSRKGRERRTTVDKFIVEDRAAFPRHTDSLVAQYLKDNPDKKSVDPALLEVNPKYRDAYAKAAAWDKKPLESELSAAFAYDDPEKYVNLVPGLSDSQKERRRMVWEHAHKDGAVEEMDAPATPSQSATPTVRKWNPQTKKLE